MLPGSSRLYSQLERGPAASTVYEEQQPRGRGCLARTSRRGIRGSGQRLGSRCSGSQRCPRTGRKQESPRPACREGGTECGLAEGGGCRGFGQISTCQERGPEQRGSRATARGDRGQPTPERDDTVSHANTIRGQAAGPDVPLPVCHLWSEARAGSCCTRIKCYHCGNGQRGWPGALKCQL